MSNHHTLQLIVVTMKKFNIILACRAIFFFLLALASPSITYAQNAGSKVSEFLLTQVHFGNVSSGIKETKIDFGDLENLQENVIDIENLKNLVFENVPTVFHRRGQSQDGSENLPQRLITDAASLSTLEIQNENWRTVKLLQIDLTQSQDKTLVRLSPQKLKSFSNLSYILIKSSFPLTKEEVSQMISGYEDGDLVLLYQINSNF